MKANEHASRRIAGAALASLPHHLGWLVTPVPHTAKLYHDPKYPDRSAAEHHSLTSAWRTQQYGG